MSSFETFSDVFEDMKNRGMKVPSDTVDISVENAKEILGNAMKYFLSLQGCKYVWQPEYAHVVEWLSCNHGKGLLMFGSCGRGKTVLGRLVIPAILLKYCRKVVTCYDIGDLDTKIDEALKMHIISIDDIGTETVSVNFGKRRMPFAEIMDAAEKQGKLLIITSNLNKEKIVEKYGDRVMDRIIATTKRIVFDGESLRK